MNKDDRDKHLLDIFSLFSLVFPAQRSSGGLSIPLCAFQGTVSLQAPTGKTLSLSTYEVSSDGLKISPNNAKKVTALSTVSFVGFVSSLLILSSSCKELFYLWGNTLIAFLLRVRWERLLISLSCLCIKYEARARKQLLWLGLKAGGNSWPGSKHTRKQPTF